MNITSNDLNTLVNNLNATQITGVEYIDVTYNETTSTETIQSSYNDILAIIDNGNLPMLRIVDTDTIGLRLIQEFGFDSVSNQYAISTGNIDYYANTATDNLSYSRQEEEGGFSS